MGFDNVLLRLQAPVTGNDADFDGDGDVDGADFLTWQKNLGTAGTATLATGDANGDKNVTAADLAIWRTQFGPAAAPVAAVPEPATPAVAALAALGVVVAYRRARTS